MKLNHINLILTDVAAASNLFEQNFDFHVEEVKGDHMLAVLKGADDFVLVLMSAAFNKTGPFDYPGAFHIGFLQNTASEVTQIYERLLAGGYNIKQAPQKIRDSFGFYFSFREIMIEVSAPL